MPQPVVIIKVFVSQCQRPDPLPQQLFHTVFHQRLIAKIHKASRQSAQHSSLDLYLTNEEQSSVAAQMAPTEIRRHFPASMGLKFKNFLITLCHSEIGFGW